MSSKPMYELICIEVIEKMLPDNFNTMFLEICRNDKLLAKKLYTNIKETFYSTSIETVIHSFNHEKELGRINASTHDSRINQFKTLFTDNNHFDSLAYQYPVWHDLQNKKISDYINYLAEIINNYYSEKDKLSDFFKKDFGLIKNIITAQGDMHSGRTVAKIEFNNGSLIYKPRSAKVDKFYQDILNIIKNSIDKNIANYTVNCISFEKHSWHEVINYADCNNMDEIHSYYQRIGGLLALFYILSSIDMHFENLISQGQFPIFIDLETIVKARRGEKKYSYQYRTLYDSVLSTSILPNKPDNRLFDVNYSAIFTSKNKSKEFKQYIIEADEDKDWIFNRVEFSLDSTKNTPKCINVSDVNPCDVEQDVIFGFKKSISYIISKKQELLKYINSLPNNAFQIRQLLRPTSVYSRFISESLHPLNTQSYDRFNSIFEILINKFNKSTHGYIRVIKEVDDLKKSNIPMFSCHLDMKDLISENEIICKDYYIETPRETMLNKIASINDVNLNDQVELIKMSFLQLYGPSDRVVGNNIKPKGYFNEKEINNILYEYTEDIKKKIFTLPENMSAISMPIIYGDSFNIVSMNSDLYNYGGLILYLAMYGKIYDSSVEPIAKELFNLFSEGINKSNSKSNTSDISVFTGDASLMYISANFSRIYNEPYYLDIFKNTVSNIIPRLLEMETEISPDFLFGHSGLIYLMCKLSKSNNFKKYFTKRSIETISSFYCDSINSLEKYEYGFAHGIHGCIPALASLYSITKNPDCIKLLKRIINSNLRNPTESKGWCRGNSGELLSYYLADKEIGDIINIPHSSNYNSLFDFLSMDNMCLCHGKYGVIDILLTLYGSPDKQLLSKWFNNLSKIQFYKSSSYLHPSFMIGTSGVAYTLMRLLNPGLPSILSLDIYNLGEVK